MQAARKWQGLATVGSILALAGGLAAITPASVAAATVHKCANKTIVITETTSEGVNHIPMPIKAITTQGIGCTGAYKFFNALFTPSSTTSPAVTPEKFKCVIAKFKAPVGLVPEQCSKPGVKIQFAVQGG
jgi:hypothetical protein